MSPYNTRSQMALHLYEKQMHGQKLCLFLDQIWTKVRYSTKDVKTTASFIHALKREILSKLCR